MFLEMASLKNDENLFKNEIKLVWKRGTKEFKQGQKMKKKKILGKMNFEYIDKSWLKNILKHVHTFLFWIHLQIYWNAVLNNLLILLTNSKY